MPFSDPLRLQFHFQRHGREFPYADAASYEQAADQFMAARITTGVDYDVRPKSGDRVRFDRSVMVLGVTDSRGAIRTFFKPKQNHILNCFFHFQCCKVYKECQ